MRLSVIIPVFNRHNYAKLCLDSLVANVDGETEIIAVDNGSLPATKRVLAEYPTIKVIRNESNLGIARACNQGLATATGEFVVFLHTDCMVTKSWSRLCEALPLLGGGFVASPWTNYSDEATFVMSKELLERFLMFKAPNKSVQPIGDIEAVVAKTYAKDGGLEGVSVLAASLPILSGVDEISSFCLAVNRETLASVGGFDESFSLRGYEEKDLLVRLQGRGVRAGRLGMFVHHFGNVTSDGPGMNVGDMMARNRGIYVSLARGYAAGLATEPPLPVSSKARVALICNNLAIGGMEMFVKTFDSLVDRNKYDVSVYAAASGDLHNGISSRVRLAKSPQPVANQLFAKWLREDRIDVAILVKCVDADDIFSSGKPCRVVERLDGTWVRFLNQGGADVSVFQSPLLYKAQNTAFPNSKHEIVLNGRDLAAFRRNEALRNEFRAEIGAGVGTVVISSIGRLCRDKRHVDLVKAFEKVREHGIDAMLVVAGPDWGEKAAILSEIEMRGLAGVARVMDGDISGPPKVLSGSDIYAHPSLCEGLSGSLIEACAAGLPIVASNAGAVGEVVAGDNGQIFAAEDIISLTGSLIEIASDRSLRAAMSAASASRAEKFSAEKMVREYERIIDEQVLIARSIPFQPPS